MRTLLLTFLLGCDPKPATEDSGGSVSSDADGDGFDEGSDCDDTDAAIHPGAVEVCDEVDNDCDGLIDVDDPDNTDHVQYYYDADGDGFGYERNTKTSCTHPGSGWLTDAGDCNDADADTNPDADEICDDGVDRDCDGLVDCEDGECAWVGTCDHPGGVYAEITDGFIDQQAWYHRHSNHPDTYWDFHSSITSVTGTVQVLKEGDLWSTATSWLTCEWGVDRIELVTGLYREGGAVWNGQYNAAPVREGFWLEEGCRLSASSSFLPELLQGYHDGANAAYRGGSWNNPETFTPWYNASLTTTWSAGRTTFGSSPFYFTGQWRTYRRTGSALGGIEFHSLP